MIILAVGHLWCHNLLYDKIGPQKLMIVLLIWGEMNCSQSVKIYLGNARKNETEWDHNETS